MRLPWWRRLPSRLLDEEAALQALAGDELEILVSHRWVRADGEEPRIFVQIKVAKHTLDLEVRFPAHYPEGCPSVRPVPHDTRVSEHQFKHSGILCLELGPDNWHPAYTAADMIRSAWRLVLYERLNDFVPLEIPSRHVPSLADRIALSSLVLLRTREFDARLRAATEIAEFEAVWMDHHVTQIVPVAFPKGTPLALPPALQPEPWIQLPAWLVPLPNGEAPSLASVPDETAAFIAFVDRHGGVKLDDTRSIVLLRWPDGETRGYFKSKDSLLKLEDMPLETGDASRTPSAISENLPGLKIGIVGLGSLGSKVAVSLARAGARRFVLVDGDVMMGENVCRHQGTYRDVGVMKVKVVKKLIADVSATQPRVKTFATHLGAATNPELHATMLEKLASCDVLIDATANPDVFGLVASLASDHRRIMAWAEVFSAGLGGLVGSAHPDASPCPRCTRAGYLAAIADWPPAPYVRSSTAYGADDDPAMVATDADVTLVAAALTNRINDLVVRNESVLPSVLLLGLRHGWIFDAPMKTVPIYVRTDDWSCPRCWHPAEEPDENVAAQAERLLTGHEHAHDPSHA